MLLQPKNPLPEAFEKQFKDRFEAVTQAAEDCGIALRLSDKLASTVMPVFAFSDFVAKSCARMPGILQDLSDTGDIEKKYSASDYNYRVKSWLSEAAQEADLLAILRKLRTREMMRIAWRDLSGMTDLFGTMADLSAFADACVTHALDILFDLLCVKCGAPESHTGEPQRLVVLAMGKLGGRELNFSSDIDLMFAFPEDGYTMGGPKQISNEEFFIKLTRRLIDLLGKSTVDGIAFRVDTRLRPYGDSGPVVMSFDAIESYYQAQGREWERYALIKARVIAGDKKAGKMLLESLKPFVFRKYLDFGVFESLRKMKNSIAREVARKQMKGNIKLGSGGIREIEFFGQVFQLIRGGVNPRLQLRGILYVLNVLADEKHIPEKVCHELSEAYVFLRNVENRLQMFADLQTHSLPPGFSDDQETMAKNRLALSMGFSLWTTFHTTLDEHMKRVHSCFNDVLAEKDNDFRTGNRTNPMMGVWRCPENVSENQKALANAGVENPGEILSLLDSFRQGPDFCETDTSGRERADRLIPLLLKNIFESVFESDTTASQSEKVLNRVLQFVGSVMRRACYLSLLLENPGALNHLVSLARVSPWIISFLSTYPMLLDELLDTRTLYAPLEKKELERELSARMARKPGYDLEYQMDELRVFKQINTFRIAAADVAGHLPLMKVSDRLTYLAETILEEVLSFSWEHLVEKYGTPSGLLNLKNKGFAVVAYGKLGGLELGYASDIDLVFFYTEPDGDTEGGHHRSISNREFYVRLGQRIVHFLTTLTPTGKLYETDMRLRPSGNSGALVSHMDSFDEYLANSAWTWEHQALIKARAVSGDADVAKHFAGIREKIIRLPRQASELKTAVADMRKKMKEDHGMKDRHQFDLKQDPGGIIDIEFLVQYLILLHAHQCPKLVLWTDVVRQLNSLALYDIIDEKIAHSLKQAYLVYRYSVHRLTLMEETAIIPVDRFSGLRERVVQIWNQFL